MHNLTKNHHLNCLAIQEPWAVCSHEEADDTSRSKFARDRDRILYSKQFRRLSGKTQVFVTGFDSLFRSRLTHTLEVVQLSTSICDKLGLNVELTEAIAMGHDVGHAPFGHVGERYLNLLMNGCYNVFDINQALPDEEKGFKHNWQSLRVVSSLEKHRSEYPHDGLNLTDYTRWGILHHTNPECRPCGLVSKQNDTCGYNKRNAHCKNEAALKINFYLPYKAKLDDTPCWSYEAFIVAFADEIAQRHHDIEDGLWAEIITKDEMVEKFDGIFKADLHDEDKIYIEKIKRETDINYYLPLFSHLIVNFLARDLISHSAENLLRLIESEQITRENFKSVRSGFDAMKEKGRIGYSASVSRGEQELNSFLYGSIINSYKAQKTDGKSEYILRQLTKAYIRNPQQLPNQTIHTLYKNLADRIVRSIMQGEKATEDVLNKLELTALFANSSWERASTGDLRIHLNKLHTSGWPLYQYALLRSICDFLAGMTDLYAIEQYHELYEANNRVF